MVTPLLPPTPHPTTLSTTWVHSYGCVIGLMCASCGATDVCTQKPVEQKGVGRFGLGTQNKKPKKIWVIHVNTRGKK